MTSLPTLNAASDHPTLTTVTCCQVLSFSAEGSAIFTWDHADPIAVNLEITLPFLDTVRVQFARELLDKAFSIPGKPAGLGDVIIEELEPGNPHIPLRGMARDLSNQGMSVFRILLARDGGSHVGLLVPQWPVVDFMNRSFMHVPAFREDAGVDVAIEKLLGTAS